MGAHSRLRRANKATNLTFIPRFPALKLVAWLGNDPGPNSVALYHRQGDHPSMQSTFPPKSPDVAPTVPSRGSTRVQTAEFIATSELESVSTCLEWSRVA